MDGCSARCAGADTSWSPQIAPAQHTDAQGSPLPAIPTISTANHAQQALEMECVGIISVHFPIYAPITWLVVWVHERDLCQFYLIHLLDRHSVWKAMLKDRPEEPEDIHGWMQQKLGSPCLSVFHDVLKRPSLPQGLITCTPCRHPTSRSRGCRPVIAFVVQRGATSYTAICGPREMQHIHR